MITSIVYTLNNSDLPEDEIEGIINIQLNTIVDMLQPEYAIIFIEELLAISGNIDTLQTIEMQEIMNEITTNMKDI